MSTAGAGARQGRRRGEQLDEAIREAVREELAEGGYAELTFEGVARRARTSKTVVYRRYDSRARMVLDAWVRPTALDSSQPDTGSLREDLRAVGRLMSARLERIGIETIRGLLAEIHPEQLQAFIDTTSSWAYVTLRAALDAARERGELGPGPISDRVASLPIVLVRNELLMHGGSGDKPLDERVLDELIDDICLPLLTRAD